MDEEIKEGKSMETVSTKGYKRVIVTFYLKVLTFILAILLLYLTIKKKSNFLFHGRKKVRIVGLYFAVLMFFFHRLVCHMMNEHVLLRAALL